MTHRFVLAVAVSALASSALAQGLAPAADIKALISARSLKCSFPFYAQADWNRDQPKVKTATQTLEFQIDNINFREQKARLIGNVGSADLKSYRGIDSVAFTEATSLASVHLTTVFAWRDERGQFKAVHSRHSSIGAPAPSQNYGYCEMQ